MKIYIQVKYSLKIHKYTTDAVLDRLADMGYVPEFGARELKRKIKTEIETPLAREILSENVAAGDTVLVDFDKSNGKMAFAKR